MELGVVVLEFLWVCEWYLIVLFYGGVCEWYEWSVVYGCEWWVGGCFVGFGFCVIVEIIIWGFVGVWNEWR